jgi:hypothetical protein
VTAEELTAAVGKFLSDARAKASGGITVAEFGQLTAQVLSIAVAGLESIPADGASKKAWAVRCVELLFDSCADSCVPLFAKPIWWLARPALRSLVLAAAGGAMEQILAMTRAAAQEPKA